MSKKHHGGPAPTPPENQSQSGPSPALTERPDPNAGSPFHEQDPKRRLGDYSGEGEHPIQQPTRLNDGDRHGK